MPLPSTNPKAFVIPTGANGSTSNPVLLNGNFPFLVVSCADVSGLPATPSISAEVRDSRSGEWFFLYEQNDPSTLWNPDLPATTFRFILTHTYGASAIRFTLSGVTTAPVTIYVQGHEQLG